MQNGYRYRDYSSALIFNGLLRIKAKFRFQRIDPNIKKKIVFLSQRMSPYISASVYANGARLQFVHDIYTTNAMFVQSIR